MGNCISRSPVTEFEGVNGKNTTRVNGKQVVISERKLNALAAGVSTQQQGPVEQAEATGDQAPAQADQDQAGTDRKEEDGGSSITTPRETPRVEISSWKKGRLLGSGAFGQVFMALNHSNGQLMAVKQVNVAAGNKAMRQMLELQKEISLLQRLKHPNIVRYLGIKEDMSAHGETTVNIFMEYVPGGSISSVLKDFGSLPEAVIRRYTKQILEGLSYLHENKIAHRDIKGANVLVDPNGYLKLADFGASTQVKQLGTVGTEDNKNTSVRGTPYWMAPEVIKGDGHGRPADIWSLGCTIIEMATGKPPWCKFQGDSFSVMFRIANANSPPDWPDSLSAACKDFLSLCFRMQPKERPNTKQLLKHPFCEAADDAPGPAPEPVLGSIQNLLPMFSPLAAGLPASPARTGTPANAKGPPSPIQEEATMERIANLTAASRNPNRGAVASPSALGRPSTAPHPAHGAPGMRRVPPPLGTALTAAALPAERPSTAAPAGTAQPNAAQQQQKQQHQQHEDVALVHMSQQQQQQQQHMGTSSPAAARALFGTPQGTPGAGATTGAGAVAGASAGTRRGGGTPPHPAAPRAPLRGENVAPPQPLGAAAVGASQSFNPMQSFIEDDGFKPIAATSPSQLPEQPRGPGALELVAEEDVDVRMDEHHAHHNLENLHVVVGASGGAVDDGMRALREVQPSTPPAQEGGGSPPIGKPYSRPGTAEAYSRPGTGDAYSRPGTGDAYSRQGTAEAYSRPGTAEAFSRPGTTETGVGSRPGTAGGHAGGGGAPLEVAILKQLRRSTLAGLHADAALLRESVHADDVAKVLDAAAPFSGNGNNTPPPPPQQGMTDAEAALDGIEARAAAALQREMDEERRRLGLRVRAL